MLRKLALDVQIHAYLLLMYSRKRQLELLCESQLRRRIELHYKIRRINVLAEQTPLLVLQISVPHLLKKVKRLRLVLEILQNRQLARLTRPVDEIYFFNGIH